jgi:hypothetical protein
MAIGLFTRCMGAVSTFAAMTRFPAAFDGVLPRPVNLQIQFPDRRSAASNSAIRCRSALGTGWAAARPDVMEGGSVRRR